MKTLITFDLELPFRHPIDTTLLDELPTMQYYHIDVDQEFVNPAFRQWANSLGYVIAGVEVFCFPKDFQMEIHVDGTEFSDKHKINWTYSEHDHEMSWYKPNENWQGLSTVYEQDDGKVDDASYAFTDLTADKIATTKVKGNASKQCTVVNSGIPHGIVTMGGPRISFSATLYPFNTTPPHKDWGVSIQTAKEHYSKYIIEGSEVWYEGTIHN